MGRRKYFVEHDESGLGMPSEVTKPTGAAPVKRMRMEDGSIKIQEVITDSSDTKEVEQPVIEISQERIKKFKRLIKSNNTDGILIALRSGIIPDLHDVVHVISKGHSRAAMACVEKLEDKHKKVLFAASRKRYDPLFHAVVDRFDMHIKGAMEMLLHAPAMYLKTALEKNITEPNEIVQSGRTPLEEVCVRKKIAHIDVLMRDPRTKGTTRAFRLMLRDPRQYPYMAACLKAGAPVTVDLIPVCLHLQQTICLQYVMQNIEEKEPDVFEHAVFVEIRDKLHCPILNDYTTSIAKTPQGHTYDKDAIFTWASKNKNDPLTREVLTIDLIQYGPKLVAAVRDWIIQELKKISIEKK